MNSVERLATLEELKRIRGLVDTAIELCWAGVYMRDMTPTDVEEHERRYGENAIIIGDYVIKRRTLEPKR